MPDADVVAMAATIYGENASEDYDTMVMTGSTMLNRLDADRPKEFGSSVQEIARKGYYAVKDNSPTFQQAITGRFPDAQSEKKWKQALQIAYGLKTGSIDRVGGHFYFTDSEVKKLKAAGKKVFDFTQVKKIGRTGKYNVFSY